MRHRLRNADARNTVLDTFDSGAQKIGETVYGKFDQRRLASSIIAPEKGWKEMSSPTKEIRLLAIAEGCTNRMRRNRHGTIA